MASIYFKNRLEAGAKLLESLGKIKKNPATIIALNTDSISLGAQISSTLQSPLQLYLASEIEVPGGLIIGSVNSSGGFSYSSGISKPDAEYWATEYNGYVEETKRSTLSSINRELGSSEVIRKDLIKGRDVILVTDVMESTIETASIIESIKPLSYKKIFVATPIIMSNIVSDIKEMVDDAFFIGQIDFFYGKDHYYEDNTVYERTKGIQIVSQALGMWPVTA